MSLGDDGNMMNTKSNGFAAFKWGTFVVLLLGSQVAIGVVAIILANSDPTVAVVPGYHKKALLWDQSVQLRQSSLAVGWQVQLRQLPGKDRTRLQWTVLDREGKAVSNIHGSVVMFHHARAGETMEFRIEDNADGIDLEREGIWQIEMTLDTDDAAKHFFVSHQIDVKRAS
jgi:nitrogen fixation protein FixH